MSTGSMTSDWYYTKRGAPAGQQVGPFTWEQLYSQAQAGQLGADDLVWNPQLPEWLPAAQIPGLIPGAPQWPAQPAAAYRPAAAQPAAAYPAAYQMAAQPKAGRSRLLAWLIPLIALIIVGGGLGAYFGFFYDRDGKGDSTAGGKTDTTAAHNVVVDMGTADCTVPDPAKLVETDGLGEVPANRISVVLADGQSRNDAKALAKTLGGKVVGEIEFIGAYQIETAGSTVADLTAALATASATPGVELAFPDLQASFFVEIWGVRQSPLNDPAYANGKDGAFQLIGAPKAWTYMRGAGLPLSEVHVGVVDNGLYRGTNEYDGDVNVYFPDSNAGEITDPDNPTGSHGTMVAGQLGADPNNGGNTGVASPVLGNLLTVSMVNNADGAYGDTPVANPDPEDPTVIQYSDGRSYSFGSLVAITKEIEAGARVINCSWGFDAKYLNDLYKKEQNGQVAQGTYAQEYQNAKDQAAAYKKFFEKMSTAHPEVLFVCAAGNTGNPGNGPFEWPAGFALPNMVSVGNVNNDGTTANTSSKVNTTPGEEFEVTLAAAGHETVQGVDKDGNPIVAGYTNGEYTNYGGGTSAASPQVAAAAALLLALDPELSAAEIKQILSDTARPGPAEVGGKILAVDQAVLEVINQQRERLGLPTVTGEELEKGGVIDAVAISQDEEGTWLVKAIVESLPSAEGAEITITSTTGTKIEGKTTQKLTAPGEVEWAPVTVPNEMAEITITRGDSGASTIIYFEEIDLNGSWEGTFTFGSFNIDQAALEQEAAGGGAEGCSLALVGELLARMQGRPFPMTMDITVDEEGKGSAVMVVDTSALAAELAAENPDMEVTSENEPQTLSFTLTGNKLTFQLDESSGATGSMTGTVRKQGEALVIDGTMNSASTGFSVLATWTVTKQE
jgi:hypothetical protein